MKILIVIPYISLIYGGPPKVVRGIAQSLGQAGNQVDILTTTANGNDNLKVSLQTWIQEPHYRIQYFPCWHRYDLIWSWSLSRWLLQHLSEYDLVHTHLLFCPLLAVTHQLCRWQQKPYVMTPHGMLEPWALANKAAKKVLYLNLIERSALRHAGLIQALTVSEQQQIDLWGLKQTTIVPNGIETDMLAKLPNPALFYQKFPETVGKTLILFLSRLDPKKGLDLLASAFTQVLAQFPQTHLVIAGPDSIGFLPTVQSYFAEAGCLSAVTFTGMLSGELKRAALAASDVYVLPSYSEGFSMSILEAMAAGLPCVITTECNFSEAAMAEAAYVVEPNAEAISDALLAFLTHPQQAKAVGSRARDLIFQHYTWDQVARQLIQSYEGMLKRDRDQRSKKCG